MFFSSAPAEPTPLRLSRVPMAPPATPQRVGRVFPPIFTTPTATPIAQFSTPVGTSARQRVHQMWQAATPQPTSQEVNVEVLAQNHKLETLTIPQLKNFLKAKGLRVGGNKGDLVARIKNFLNVL